MEAFDKIIGQPVVGCCLCMLDVEQVAQGGLQGGGELGAEVGCDDSFEPAGSSIHDSKQVGKTLGYWKGPTKSTVMWLNLSRAGFPYKIWPFHHPL